MIKPPAIVAPPNRWLDGAAGYDRARALHQRTGVPVLLYVWVDWCPYCRAANAKIAQPATANVLAPVIKVRVNPERGPRERAIADAFAIRAYPKMRMIYDQGRVREKVSVDGKGSMGEFLGPLGRAIDRVAKHHRRRARQLASAGSHRDAVVQIDHAIALRPKDIDMRLMRAQIFEDAHDFAAATSELRTVIRHEARHPEAHAELARLSYFLGKDADTLRYAKRLQQIDPGSAVALYYRAAGEFQLGMPDEALTHARSACDQGSRPGCKLARWLHRRGPSPAGP